MALRRRHLLKAPALLALSATARQAAPAASAAPASRTAPDGNGLPANPLEPSPADFDPRALRWLDGAAPPEHAGATWGWPWARGQVRRDQAFALRDGQGRLHALQSWPLAWWPDGSLKWSGHALPPALTPSGEPSKAWQIVALPAGRAAPASVPALRVEETPISSSWTPA